MFHTIVSIKNDGHYFCRAGGNRPDGLNEPVTFFIWLGYYFFDKGVYQIHCFFLFVLKIINARAQRK
ncbi:hypothetical protein DDG49_10850 [Escherichia coli]|nr:hypothetical protein [Escherichia coli]